jgi:hypothetical protein
LVIRRFKRFPRNEISLLTKLTEIENRRGNSGTRAYPKCLGKTKTEKNRRRKKKKSERVWSERKKERERERE